MKHLKGWRGNKDVDGTGITNDDRVERAEVAIAAYRAHAGDMEDESHGRDLITDLCHYFASNGIDYRTQIDWALSSFEEER